MALYGQMPPRLAETSCPIVILRDRRNIFPDFGTGFSLACDCILHSVSTHALAPQLLHLTKSWGCSTLLFRSPGFKWAHLRQATPSPLELRLRAWAIHRKIRFPFVRQFLYRVIQLHCEHPQVVYQPVVADHGRDGHKETGDGRCSRHPGRDGGQVRVALLRSGTEYVHHTPDRAQQPDERCSLAAMASRISPLRLGAPAHRSRGFA